MPCSDGRDRPEVRYEKGYKPGCSPVELIDMRFKSNQLEAALCAIMNELKRRNIAGSVVSIASEKGNINILDIWDKHKDSDVSRLSKELNKYSEDEQDIIRSLLSEP
jgi:hypothetical protein